MIRILPSLLSIFWFSACATAQSFHISASDKATVIEAVANHLETDYVEAELVGMQAAIVLRADFSSGLFEQVSEGSAFAELISARVQELTGDGHLNVEYSEERIDEGNDAQKAFDEGQLERWYGAQVNYGVRRIERLEGNIGYLDLSVFPPIDMGGETVAAALTVLADTDALIIDLRRNGGGIGDTADLVASYLFSSERQPLTGIYHRPSDKVVQRFTQPFVSGKRFGPDKPVFVLISAKTFSAAEALAYNLQALGRATIVGEPSGGGAHPFEYMRVHPHFVLWSVTAKSVNPITGGNWQSVGVQPDIAVKSENALSQALSELGQ